jgi:ribosome-binding factor A
MSGERPRRVAEQIQRFLSSALIGGLRDPRLGFATVTGVEVSPDLKSARVFVTVLDPDPAKRKGSLDALNHAAGHFRHEMGRELRLRYTPTLRFEEDTSIERADRIERLIRTMHHDEDAGEGLAGGAEHEETPGSDESE